MSAVTYAIDQHTATLKRLLAILLVYAGLTDENEEVRSLADMRRCAGEPFALSRRTRDFVLRLLVPVESATRRLIILIASQLPEKVQQSAARPTQVTSPRPHGADFLAPLGRGVEGSARDGEGSSTTGADQASFSADPMPPRLPLFALADTPKRFDWLYNPQPEGAPPWIGPGAARADPFERLDVRPLMRRVAALHAALGDLPAQARRFLRWRAMRVKARAAGKHLALSTLRIGLAPGAPPRRAPRRIRDRPENDALLKLDGLARHAEKGFWRLDSS